MVCPHKPRALNPEVCCRESQLWDLDDERKGGWERGENHNWGRKGEKVEKSPMESQTDRTQEKRFPELWWSLVLPKASTLAGERIAGKRILGPSWFTGLAVLSPGPLLHLS